MNNIADKIKQAFSSNFGKLAGIISVLSFIITLILSILYKNRIDISLLKAIISGVITIIILFLIGVILKKYLGDSIIEESASNSANEIDYNAIDDSPNSNTSLDSIVQGDDAPTSNFNPDNISINPSSSSMNIDKKTKSDYHSSGDDIGDIVFGNTSSASNTNYSAPSTMFPEKKVANSEILKEVHEDPEKVAKAVRTMIAKDEKEDNK